ncbi:hypothetical protein JZ751_024150 [Albula glossodonta]|uniref:Uncharacterized protein n=1 Tax=Albula glossodonta TaxID=121402 RepID=A0A8T2NFV5_9TELE|nr:hypothetical protein JZ751_024150 [Albula glossodonta]
MLTLSKTFDLQKDVISHILRKDDSARQTKEPVPSAKPDARIINVEKDGGVLYSWKGFLGNTRIGKYDPNSKQNKLLYSFDKEVFVSSCSINKEETLLAVSLSQRSKREDRLESVSKCKTLLIEIHPQNNIKVLKAVDCRIRVQFLDPDSEKKSVHDSHLLLIAEDGYVEQYHILLIKQEGYRVVIQNPERLVKDRVVEEFSWVQWDVETQRLFYLTSRFELQLELPASLFTSVRFVNLGYDHHKDDVSEDEGTKLVIFTSKTGKCCSYEPLCT